MSENLSSFLGNAESIPKRVMPIFFLIDTSGSGIFPNRRQIPKSN